MHLRIVGSTCFVHIDCKRYKMEKVIWLVTMVMSFTAECMEQHKVIVSRDVILQENFNTAANVLNFWYQIQRHQIKTQKQGELIQPKPDYESESEEKFDYDNEANRQLRVESLLKRSAKFSDYVMDGSISRFQRRTISASVVTVRGQKEAKVTQ